MHYIFLASTYKNIVIYFGYYNSNIIDTLTYHMQFYIEISDL